MTYFIRYLVRYIAARLVWKIITSPVGLGLVALTAGAVWYDSTQGYPWLLAAADVIVPRIKAGVIALVTS